MSKRDLSCLLATCLLFLLSGESEGQLQLSVDTSDVTKASITLHCRNVHPQDSGMESGGDNHNGMEMQMMKQHGGRENESLQFKLNNSVIYPNSTLLHNYSVESLDMDAGHHYIAHFQLINPHEMFLGNFTCVSNCTISNEVLLTYLPLNVETNLNMSLPLAESTQYVDAIFSMGISLAIAFIVIITMCICLTVACCKSHKSSDQVNKASSGSWDQFIPTKSQSSKWRDQSIIQFTTNGYAVPKCSLAQMANGREKQHNYSSNTHVISKRTISKVLKYLLHPSNCSQPNCLCKEVKNEYYALVNELKPDMDHYAPCNLTSLASESVIEIPIDHEVMQGQGQEQMIIAQGDDQIHCSAIKIEDDHTSSYCKDGCSLVPTSGQSCIHYPKLSPVSESGPELKLSYVDPVERVTFDSKGGRYFNQDHNIGLKVPPGAVPEGEQVTIEIGVSLSCPILFPAGTRPVSAMLSMCVVGNPNYQFQKPVEVRLAHCLDITTKEAANDLEIEFLKSGHNLFCFHKAEGNSTFEPGTHCGVLATKHFCCFCIAANKCKADLTKIYYRLIKVVPNSTSSLRWKVRYCITYFLNTCLRALEKQYNPQKYDIQSLQRFKFATNASSDKPYVGISFERRVVGGWNLALETSDRINANHVDFWDIEPSDLELMETEELYPPRFVIDVCGTQAHSTGQVWVNFSGMENEFKSELILDTSSRGLHQCIPAFLSGAAVLRGSSSESALYCYRNQYLPQDTEGGSVSSLESSDSSVGPSDRDLMNKVAATIPTKWRLVGLQLGLEQPQLEMIEQKHSFTHNSIACFGDVFTEWKRRRTSDCSWSTIINALNSQLVGEAALAHKLQTELETSSTDSGINIM